VASPPQDGFVDARAPGESWPADPDMPHYDAQYAPAVADETYVAETPPLEYYWPGGPPDDGPAPWTEEDQARLDELNELKRRRSRRLVMELVQTLVLATLIFFAVRTMAQNFKVEGSSMEPGLHDGQYLLVNKAIYFQINLDTVGKFIPFIHVSDNPQHYLFHGPHRGDVIVFRYPADPSRDFIKRVIGVPGDSVEIVHGVLMVNNQPVKEEYIPAGVYDMTTEKKVVPDGQYFVLGDNRNNSSDSRAWGFVPAENIIGQAMFSYWPLDNAGGVGNARLNLGVVQVPVPSFSLPSISLPF
jgi:signal peptidase I